MHGYVAVTHHRWFRVAVTDACGRACAITGEHSLPALEAAHIRPYASEGPHDMANGLLLRADYENGRSYYPFDGRELRVPASPLERPNADSPEVRELVEGDHTT